jgi:2-haloacid dehalogenase
MIKNIVFDLGGVLIDWNPEYVFLKEFNGDRKKMNWFFDEICTEEWNLNQDEGYSIEKATNELIELFPDHKHYIKMFYGRWEEMLGGPINESVDVLKKIVKNSNYRVFALTNWSAETFPVALERYDFLKLFEGIVVSGIEKTRKPNPEIFKLTLNRFEIKAEETFFIDDNYENISTAKKLKFKTYHFKNSLELKNSIKQFLI